MQKTVKQEVPNGIVDKISTETKDGQLVYKVKFQDEGLNPAIFVASDGTLIKSDLQMYAKLVRDAKIPAQ